MERYEVYYKESGKPFVAGFASRKEARELIADMPRGELFGVRKMEVKR